MWACLTRLKDGLALLRHYIDGLEKQDRLLATDPAACGAAIQLVRDLQDHYHLRNNKNRYDYNTIVISLYGYLERFIEDVIGEYLEQVVSLVPKFSDLPLALQENHLQLSLDLARKADHQRYAAIIRPEEIVAKLYACYSSPDKYQLNVLAFAQHTANFLQTVITQTLSQCGITDLTQAIKKAEPFTTFLQSEDPERDVERYLGADDDIVFSRLNDLAARRNDIAHGSFTDDILSRDILEGYIDFVEAYAEALALVAYERTLPFMVSRAVPLGGAIAVINNNIVCVTLADGEIAVGDTLIAKAQDKGRPFKGGVIKEIQRDRVPIERISGGSGVQVGMRVEFRAKDNQEFYCFKVTRNSL